MAQGQYFLHDVGVVPLPGVGAGVRSASHIGRVDFFAQRTVIRIGHYREIGGEVQRKQPAFLAFCLGRLTRQVESGFRQTG